jgi:glutaryl-CoA dehydrogenase
MAQTATGSRGVRPLDFLHVDGLLTDEERDMRDVVRAFVRERVLPGIGDWFEDARLPADELAPELGRIGVLGMHLQGYGCLGAGATAYGLACMELEAGDSGVRSLVSVQGSLAMYAIWRWGSEEQKQRWLGAMAAGEAIGCFGLTEPDAGSDPAAMRTRARRDGADWVLHGQKMWITNGSIADVAVVWAQTDDEIRGFLVERGTPGFSAPEMKGKWSLRASVTSELVLDDVTVDDEASLLPEVRGLKGPLSCLNQARYGIAWGALGAADACYQCALEYAKTRTQFDRPIAAFQLTQEKLAWMLTELTKGQLLALQLGRLKDQDQATPQQVSMAKMNNVAIAREIASRARSILGANGILGEYPVMRHMANLEAVSTYEGTHEMHTLILGEAVTGIPAFRG